MPQTLLAFFFQYLHNDAFSCIFAKSCKSNLKDALFLIFMVLETRQNGIEAIKTTKDDLNYITLHISYEYICGVLSVMQHKAKMIEVKITSVQKTIQDCGW